MINFNYFSGIITAINEHFINNGETIEGCNKTISVTNQQGTLVNFVVSPTTYFVNNEMVAVGDKVTGYYDGTAPALLIFPPQYQTLIMVKESTNQNVKVSYFNNQLESSDRQLKLNISPYTQIILTNNQPFLGNLSNRNLIVIYGASTKSIPAQTTPYKVIVWCKL